MDVKRQQICGFCSNNIQNDFGNTDEIIKEIFQILLLEVNLDKSTNSSICRNCVEIAKRCLHFKSAYINTESVILLFALNSGKISFDIRDIWKDNCTNTVDENMNTCRFCMSVLNVNKFVKLDAVINESIRQLLPEVDWSIIKDPLICITCESNIKSYLSFVTDHLRIVEQDSKDNKILKKNHRYELLFKDILGPPHHYKKPARQQELEQDTAIAENSELYGRIHENAPQATSKEIGNSSKKSTLKKHICPWCSFKTSYKGVLEVHILVHDDNEKKKITQTQTSQGSKAKTHVGHNEDRHKCTFCPYSTRQKCVLAKHMLAHKDMSGTELYQCSFCSFKAKLKKNLNSHLTVHKSKRKAGLNERMLVHKDANSDF